MNVTVSPVTRSSGLQGTVNIPGDKSISHRALLFGALAEGTTTVTHLLDSGDVRSTWSCLAGMGIEISGKPELGEPIIVRGRGLRGLRAPTQVLDCGNSGTTIRHLMGILAGQSFESVLTGDASLRKRPMKRVAEPLRKMGAKFELTQGDLAPVTIHGGRLQAIEYSLPVASAQLKSALILAGLYAEDEMRISGLIDSRDHTERLLPHFGVALQTRDGVISIRGNQTLKAADVKVPGDPSTAAFWIAAATLIPGSDVRMENVSMNPTRIGFIQALKRMGANIETQIVSEHPEPVGTLRIRSAKLRGTVIHAEEVPALIDEIPLLAVLGAYSEGETEVLGAEELRVKESDRIEAVAKNLRAMGAVLETRQDGLVIRGPQKLRGAVIDSQDDHRIAMAFSVAALAAEGETEVRDVECVGISYPGFYRDLKELTS